MIQKGQIALVVCITMIALSACSLGGTNISHSCPDFPSSSDFKVGDAAKWPDYVPADIPPLVGHICTLVEPPGGNFIRLDYIDVSKNQVKTYLNLLEQKGFKLEYIVYTQPSIPDTVAQERLKRGDYDAVDITKEKFHMRIEYGGNSISYWIDTPGFEEAMATALATAEVRWPSGLEGLVPQPDRCSLISISPIPSQPQGYRITCSPADKNVGVDYIQTLEAAGFVPQEIKKTDDTVLNATFTKDKTEVFLGLEFSSRMTIEVSQIAP